MTAMLAGPDLISLFRNDGVLLARVAAPDVFIPSDRLVEVRLDRAIAGSGYEPGGVLIFQWRHGDRLLDTGVRLTRTDLHPAVASATAPLIPETVAGGLE